MRSVVRRSSRLSACSRYNAPTTRRAFSTAHVLSSSPSDPRIPASLDAIDVQPSRVDSWNKWAGVETSPTANATSGSGDQTTRFEVSGEAEDKRTKSDESTETRPRRTIRQRRLADVPLPPPIPDWFLQHNVLLTREVLARQVERGEDGSEDTKRRIIVCRDKETGHVLYTIADYSSPEDVGRLGMSAAAGEPAVVQKTDKEDSNGRTSPVSSKNEVEPGSAASTEDSANQTDPKRATYPPFCQVMEPMMWTLLEAELGISAAFGLSSPTPRQSNFASSRLDLSLVCPDDRSHLELDLLVKELAVITNADLIRIDANDLEDLAGDYVDGGRDSANSFATLGYDVFDGYVASDDKAQSTGMRPNSEQDDEADVDELDETEEDDADAEIDMTATPGLPDALKKLGFSTDGFKAALKGVMLIPATTVSMPGAAKNIAKTSANDGQGSSAAQTYVQWDDVRLGALLNNLLNAPLKKRQVIEPADEVAGKDVFGKTQIGLQGYNHKNALFELIRKGEYQNGVPDRQTHQRFANRPLDLTSRPQVVQYRKAIALALFSHSEFRQTRATSQMSLAREETQHHDHPQPRSTIVHLRDLKDVLRTTLGEGVVRRLLRIVQKRRMNGERVIIVGTSAQSGLGSWSNEEPQDSLFRTMIVPPYFTYPNKNLDQISASPWTADVGDVTSDRILDINLRHLQSMLRRMHRASQLYLLDDNSKRHLAYGGSSLLSERVLSIDDVHRLSLLATGLSRTYAISPTVQPSHIGLACFITSRVDQLAQIWTADSTRSKVIAAPKIGNQAGGGSSNNISPPESLPSTAIEKLKENCNQHETRLLAGVVDARNIRTGFDDVHVPADTIQALKTLTELALLRPSAFEYGVLAKDRLPGLLLYGPPGTGKTLLAKAVARSSQSTVLEVTGAQIFEKYVGEGEKMVRAVFTLARKLSPCVVFIDEADSIFGSRSDVHARNSHRAIINQFLREWDGMDDHGVFIMVATNRPFDLDDAVLRRLPRRLLVDLPLPSDREQILAIHLNGEQLDSSVSLSGLATQTPLYSGSDLKNLCVSAALACVREENNLLTEKRKTDAAWELPKRRTLSARHFEKALAEIAASISEDMATLTAIRKFDEQYGDRKGRRPKSRYGFGQEEIVVDESAARVRQNLARGLVRQESSREGTVQADPGKIQGEGAGEGKTAR